MLLRNSILYKNGVKHIITLGRDASIVSCTNSNRQITQLYLLRTIHSHNTNGTADASVNLTAQYSDTLKNDPDQRNQVYLYGKSENDITETLQKLNLIKLPMNSKSNIELLCTYLQKLNVMNFKKTTTHLNRFKTFLNKQQQAIDNNDILLYKYVIDYLIEESDMEVKRLVQFGPVNLIQSRLDNLLTQNDDKNPTNNNNSNPQEDVEAFVLNNLFEKNFDLEYPYLSHLQSLFNILNELRINNSIQWDQYISIDQLVDIFEMSKLIPNSMWKDKGIFLSASLLYSNGKIRMDPVNESFFINTLIKFGHYKQGFKLFQTNKDNIKERWWMEMGLMLSLVNNNLRTFQKLLYEMDHHYRHSIIDTKSTSNAYLSPKILKFAIKKYCKIYSSKSNKLQSLLNRFIDNIQIYGIQNQNKAFDNQPNINFENENEANSYLNEIVPISYDEIVSVINSLLYYKHTDLIGPFLNKILSLKDIDPSMWHIILIKTKLNLLKDFNCIKSILPKFNETPSKLYNLAKFETIFNQTTSKYLEEKNVVIDMLLFDNINDLVTNYKVPINLENILERLLASNKNNYNNINNSGNNKIALSQYFNVLLKSFLSCGNLSKANRLIQLMEKVRTDKDFALQNEGKYPPIDINHYSTMIKYYTNKRTKNHKPKIWKQNEKKIIEITNKVNSFGFQYTSSFITKLLIFYRENRDYNRCFQIINKTLQESNLYQKSETSSDDLNENELTTPFLRQILYFEIWKIYFQFYKYESLDLITAGNQKNIRNWKLYHSALQKKMVVKPEVDLLTLFDGMVNRDNVLPNLKFSQLILTTFMKSRDWTSIPAIVTQLTQVFNIELDKEFISKILVGIKKEFIATETKCLLQQNKNMSFIEAKQKAKQEAKNLKYDKNDRTLQLNDSDDNVTNLLGNIILLLKYQNQYDTEFTEVKKVYQKLNLIDFFPEDIIKACK